MMRLRRKKLLALVNVLLVVFFLSSCVHIVVQEITVKSKFAKKYHCPRRDIAIVESDANSRGDVYKLVGCGVTAVYNGTQEVYTQK